MNFQPFKAGDHLEYLAAAVFQGDGYLVRRSVPLIISEEVTDIDILGIKFIKPFQPQKIICDCKDKQRSKPYERIFWAKGLANFVNASETFVVIPKSSWKVFDFARSGQVRVLTSQVLNDAYRRIYGEKKNAIGLANMGFYEPFYKRLSEEFKKDPQARQSLLTSRSILLMQDPYVSMNIAIYELKKVAGILGNLEKVLDPRFQLWRYIASDLIVVTSLLFLYIASDTQGFSPIDRARHISEKLTYGDIAPSKAKEIFSLAQQLAIEAAKSTLPSGSLPNLSAFDLGSISVPEYVADICGLVDRAIQSPNLYNELPQLLDFLLFEVTIQDKGFSEDDFKKMFPSHFQQERLKVARNIISFVRDSCSLNLQVLWP